MKKEIITLFNKHQDYVLDEVAQRYRLQIKRLKKLGSFESYVFEYEPDDLIIRITHSIRRSKAYMLGELEFVRYLAEHHVPVAQPIPSINGELVEIIALDDSNFLVSAFEKANGHEPEEKELTPDFFVKWGTLTGRIHSLSKRFKPSNPKFKRQEWYQEEVLDFSRYVPASHAIVHEKKAQLINQFQLLPKNKDSYGLTHNDNHHGNIHTHNGTLTIFDFDDCSYHWFVNDIAIAVHSILPGYDQADQFNDLSTHFMTHFMRGYFRENQIDRDWLGRIPDYLRLYDLLNFGVIHQAWNLNNLNETRKQTIERIKNRIENEICIVTANFEQFGN